MFHRIAAFAFSTLFVALTAGAAWAVNSVVVQSVTALPSAIGVTVGVSITNDVGIAGISLPLELRCVCGGAYVTGPSFTFGMVAGSRVHNSPLGPAGPNWPAASTTCSKYAVPGTPECSNLAPPGHTYTTSAAQIDFVCPDAAFCASNSTGDPGLGDDITLDPGTDGGAASYRFTFNVNGNNGKFEIDTCCVRPANHLLFADANTNAIVPSFTKGVITVGTGGAGCDSGACCLPDGSCVMVDGQGDCDSLGGFYLGDGSDCDTDTCKGQLMVCKFDDENCNGVRDPNEGGVPNVTVHATGPAPATTTLNAITDQGGCADFGAIPVGSYKVWEEIPPNSNMVQTTPVTVFSTVTVLAGVGVVAPEFGNRDTLCTDASEKLRTDTCLAGKKDNFLQDGPELASPSPALCAALSVSCPFGPRDDCNPLAPGNCSEFDCPGADRCFGHTFDCWDSTCCVLKATLNLKVRASASGSSSDVIYLVQQNSAGAFVGVYGEFLRVLNTGGGGTWNVGQVMTLSLDLANLPMPGFYGLPNVLAALQDGGLDVRIEDDTEVDFLELIVTTCCDTCYQDSLPIGTGYDHQTGTQIATGLSDPYWYVVSDPTHPITSGGHDAEVITKHANWPVPSFNTQWIAAHPSDNVSAPLGVSEFRFCFCLETPVVNPSLYIGGLVDNIATVYLNGDPNPIFSFAGHTGPGQFITFTDQSRFLDGRNCIRVEVENEDEGSPTGLNIFGWVTQDNRPGVGLKDCCDSCSISGIKFFDENHNGVNDGEPILSNWPVTLNWFNGPVFATAITNGSGAYTFSGLPCASWTVTEAIPSPWAQTFPAPANHSFSHAFPGADVTGIDFGNWACDTTTTKSLFLPPCCLKPPPNMALWLPFDEAAGPTAYNAAGGNDGTHINSPVVTTNGAVRNALCFAGATNYVQVNPYPAIFGPGDPGTGDFTLDAWVQRAPNDNGARFIIEKGGHFGNSGYRLYLQDGLIAFGLARPGFAQLDVTTSAVPTTGWHHVAVTAERGIPLGGKIYLDGAVVKVFSLINVAGFSLSSAAPFRVGGVLPDVFLGCIDEVEMFRRALTSAEILAIYEASGAGKCKRFCTIPWDEPFCKGVNQITVYPQICNATSLPTTLEYYFVGMSPNGTTCQITGPTVFDLPTGPPTTWPQSVTVPAGQCVSVPVKITRPGGMNANGLVGCYQMVVTNPATGEIFSCEGSVQDARNWCWTFPGIRAFTGVFTAAETLTVNAFVPVDIGPITLTNGQETQATLDYQIVVMDDEMNLDMSAVKLNGLPPGTPVIGSVTLGPGASTIINLTAEFVVYDPLHWYTILVQYDADGDGDMDDPLASAGFRNVIPSTDCACDCHGDPACDGFTSILDVVETVNAAFRNDPPAPDPNQLCPYETTDTDCNGFTDVLDVVHEVNVAFRNGNPATEFCNPCP